MVDGSTRLLGVVGDPIAQVRAPGVWSGLFRHNAVNAICVPMHVRPPSLATFFAGIRTLGNLQGLIVTIPHKPVILGLLDGLTTRAAQVGVVNAVAIDDEGRTLGETFDGVGFVAGLRAAGKDLSGARALVVGSGGVGASIAFAVAEAGARDVSISDVVNDRASALAARLQTAGFRAKVGPPDPSGFDLVVNATPLGMRASDPLPFDCAQLDPAAIVVDVVISQELTPVLAAARDRGCFVQPGAVMTDYLISSMAEFFGFGAGDWSAEAIAKFGLVESS
jgi:shikimate dehydrogenase